MNDRHPYLIPITILIAGALLAIAIYVVRTDVSVSPLEAAASVRPVSPDDHMIGNPEAPVIVVEYSDIDCAYCKSFQATMAQLMSEYGEGGQVAWVYRHLPLIPVHPNAGLHAEAAECVAEQGGDPLFFSFIDALQQAAPGSDQFNPNGYGAVVSSLGLSQDVFTQCMESDRFVERVANDIQNAKDAGAGGTPYIVILVRGADPIPVTGALPYEPLKQVIEEAISRVR